MTYIHQQHYIRVPSKYFSWIKRYLWRNPLQLKKMTKQGFGAGVRCQMYAAKCLEFKWLYITDSFSRRTLLHGVSKYVSK
jgi:hypothetical protein